MSVISLSILHQLRRPQAWSHKGQNGILYIVAGSKQYHGSLWFAIETASHFVDLIYVETDLSNHALVRDLKKLHPAIILVSARQRKNYLAKSDCVLLGPGLGKGAHTKKLVHSILASRYCPIKRVIDADALYCVSPKLLTANTILTPHPGEYAALFGQVAPRAISKKIVAIVVAKGPATWICQNGKCDYNTESNAGLTKGGTGDVLASLIAALSCTNSVWLASRAACVLQRQTARDLSVQSGTYYSILELIQHFPSTLHKYQ